VEEVAAFLGVSCRSVRRWVTTALHHGEDALASDITEVNGMKERIKTVRQVQYRNKSLQDMDVVLVGHQDGVLDRELCPLIWPVFSTGERLCIFSSQIEGYSLDQVFNIPGGETRPTQDTEVYTGQRIVCWWPSHDQNATPGCKPVDVYQDGQVIEFP